MGLKDKIRNLARKTVTVLGESVEVRALNAAERIAFEDSIARDDKGEPDRVDILVRVVVACTSHPDGSPVFTAEDVAWLKTDADSLALKELYREAGLLNGLVEGAEKN